MLEVSTLRPGADLDAVDGVVPRHVAEPEDPETFAKTLATASTDRLQTLIRGGGTKIDWGRPASRIDLLVSTARLNRLVAHRHGDLTATVQAGVRLVDFNTALQSQRQWLPVESAFDAATIGGIVATNDAGPARHRNGTPRDLVIGITLALADGRLVKAGGTVVKNVAGYDMGKLVSGSHGTLAGIVDVTFKLMPIPRASATLAVRYDDPVVMSADVASLSGSQVEPAAFDVAMEDRTYSMLLRVATSPAATDAQMASARAMVSGDSRVVTGEAEAALWQRQIHAPWEAGEAVVRFSWLPANLLDVLTLLADIQRSGTPAMLAGRALGAGLLRLGGSAGAQAAAVNRLRSNVAVGHVVMLRATPALKAAVDVWGPGRDSDTVARALKQKFDPAGVLNAGRGPI
jgi:glycolate oxidase FAD binding subunit